MSKAALPSSAWKANLDRLDDAGRSVRADQVRVVQAAPLHVLEERRHRLGIFLRSCHQMQQHPTALNRKAPGRQNRLALGAGSQPLGNAVDKKVSDLVFAQVPPGKGLIILPQPFPEL